MDGHTPSPAESHPRSGTPFKRSFDQVGGEMDGAGSSSSAHGAGNDVNGNKRVRNSSPVREDLNERDTVSN